MTYRHNYNIDMIDYILLETSKLLANRKKITNTILILKLYQ
jgi:hypothetical protein